MAYWSSINTLRSRHENEEIFLLHKHMSLLFHWKKQDFTKSFSSRDRFRLFFSAPCESECWNTHTADQVDASPSWWRDRFNNPRSLVLGKTIWNRGRKEREKNKTGRIKLLWQTWQTGAGVLLQNSWYSEGSMNVWGTMWKFLKPWVCCIRWMFLYKRSLRVSSYDLQINSVWFENAQVLHCADSTQTKINAHIAAIVCPLQTVWLISVFKSIQMKCFAVKANKQTVRTKKLRIVC